MTQVGASHIRKSLARDVEFWYVRTITGARRNHRNFVKQRAYPMITPTAIKMMPDQAKGFTHAHQAPVQYLVVATT